MVTVKNYTAETVRPGAVRPRVGLLFPTLQHSIVYLETVNEEGSALIIAIRAAPVRQGEITIGCPVIMSQGEGYAHLRQLTDSRGHARRFEPIVEPDPSGIHFMRPREPVEFVDLGDLSVRFTYIPHTIRQ